MRNPQIVYQQHLPTLTLRVLQIVSHVLQHLSVVQLAGEPPLCPASAPKGRGWTECLALHTTKKIMCVRNMRASPAASHMHAAQIMQMHMVRWKATSCPISYISSRQTFREVMPALGKYDNRGLYRNESFRTNETCQPMLASTKTLMLAASTVCSRKTTLTNDTTLYSPRRLSPTALLVLIPPRGT